MVTNSLLGKNVLLFSSIYPVQVRKINYICWLIFREKKMSAPKCPICHELMKKHGKTKAGKQRWICKSCKATKTHAINSDAKQLKIFLDWLLSRKRQTDITHATDRTFRNRTARFWKYWALPPLIDEIHKVVYVDGFHLGRKAVVLIACSDECVLGWYLARHEHTQAWVNLLRRIAPPDMVVSDGGQGFRNAVKQIWPDTQIQRCAFHAFNQVRRCTTHNPRLVPGRELLLIAIDLLHIKTEDEALVWLKRYFDWCKYWDEFLAEKSYIDGKHVFTHEKLRKAKRSLNRLISSGHLFTYLDPILSLDTSLPSTNNRIEGGVNAPLREMLRLHRGMSLNRKIKAILWWCYLHTECPLGPADILKVMPTDDDIDEIYNKLARNEKLSSDIPKWGDAIMWSELHHIDLNHDAFRHDWD